MSQDYVPGDIIYYTQKAQYRGLRQVRVTRQIGARNGRVAYYAGEILKSPNPKAVGQEIHMVVSHMTKSYDVALRRIRKQVQETKKNYAASRLTMERYEASFEANLKAAEEMLV